MPHHQPVKLIVNGKHAMDSEGKETRFVAHMRKKRQRGFIFWKRRDPRKKSILEILRSIDGQQRKVPVTLPKLKFMEGPDL